MPCPIPSMIAKSQAAVAHRVIERVAGDVVRGLKQPGDQDARGPGVQRRQQIPLHPGRQRHLPPLPPDVRDVAHPRGGGDGQPGEHAEQFDLLQQFSARVRRR